MTVTVLEERPPLIECFSDSIEDRAASIKEGHYVGKDVVFFKVTPVGGKLEVILEAEAHLKTLRRAGDKFLPMYEAAYAAYKDGAAPPVNGTALKDWPQISPAELKTLLSCNIRSIEDLATVPEEALNRIGMGARALQNKAIAWLNAAAGPGKAAEEIAALKAEMGNVSAEMKRIQQENLELRAKLEAHQPRENMSRRGGRKSQDEEAA